MTSQVIEEQDFFKDGFRISQKIIKVDKSQKFPHGLKYKINIMTFEDDWVSVARIDNHIHEKGKTGQHLHRMDKGIENADYSIDLNLEDMIDYLLKIAKEIKR